MGILDMNKFKKSEVYGKIKELYSQGKSASEIASEIGASESFVRAILKADQEK